MITELWTGIKTKVGQWFPADTDNNGKADSVERLEAMINSLLNQSAYLTAADVIAWCAAVDAVPMTNAEKRDFVFKHLREMCTQIATWALYAAIEIAVGILKARAK